jgi:hypothetical protein
VGDKAKFKLIRGFYKRNVITHMMLSQSRFLILVYNI